MLPVFRIAGLQLLVQRELHARVALEVAEGPSLLQTKGFVELHHVLLAHHLLKCHERVARQMPC